MPKWLTVEYPSRKVPAKTKRMTPETRLAIVEYKRTRRRIKSKTGKKTEQRGNAAQRQVFH
jgi:hypothetical protein